MALKPGKYTSRYNISDTILDRVVQNGTETFRGSGSDYSEIGSEVIYIANVPLKRVVVLKAFIESANYSIAKSTEITEEKDKNRRCKAIYVPFSSVMYVPRYSCRSVCS